MIARDAPGGGLVLVSQPAHARLTGPLVDAWRWVVPRRADTARACATHDDGWRAWDANPRVDADGRPFTYRNMPPEPYRDLWRRGFADAWADGDWIGLLVSLHGSRFFDWKKDEPEDAAILTGERERQRTALARLGHADADPPARLPPDVAAGFAMVRYLDGLSLFLCEEWDAPWTADAPGPDLQPVKLTAARADARGTVTLDPWPFDVEEVGLEVEGAHTARDSWADDAAFAADVADAPRVTLEWRLGPA